MLVHQRVNHINWPTLRVLERQYSVQYSTEPVGAFRIALGRLRGSSSTGRKAFRCGVMARLWSVRFSATTHGLPPTSADHKNVGENERSWWKGLTHGENFGENLFHGAIGFFARLQNLTVGFLLRSQLGMQKRAEECQLWEPSLWLWLFQRHQIQSLWLTCFVRGD